MSRERDRRLAKLETRMGKTSRKYVYRFTERSEIDAIKAEAAAFDVPIAIMPVKCASAAEWLERYRPQD